MRGSTPVNGSLQHLHFTSLIGWAIMRIKQSHSLRDNLSLCFSIQLLSRDGEPLLRRYQFYIAPNINPDGYQYSFYRVRFPNKLGFWCSCNLGKIFLYSHHFRAATGERTEAQLAAATAMVLTWIETSHSVGVSNLHNHHFWSSFLASRKVGVSKGKLFSTIHKICVKVKW